MNQQTRLKPNTELIGIETPVATYAIFRAMAIRVEMEAEKQARRMKRKLMWQRMLKWTKNVLFVRFMKQNRENL